MATDTQKRENGNGEGASIDDLAKNGNGELGGAEEEPKPTPPMQVPLPGTEQLISLAAGGAPPTSSEARLLGGSLPIEGQFSKGDTLMLAVEVKVGAVEFVDSTDDWGNVQKTTRRHKMRMLSVRRA